MSLAVDIDVKFRPIVSVVQKSVIGFSSASIGRNLDKKFNEICDDIDKLLFISINMDLISKLVGSGAIFDLINKFNIDPKRVVLEICENNLDKIFHVQPNIIKIGEPITKSIETYFYKQTIFKALVNLSKKSNLTKN